LTNIRFKCNPEKTTQGLNFFAIKEGGSINKLKALKLLFFADRYHLRKYGRLVTNDKYIAMEHGPVPSNAKDIAESKFDYSCDIPAEYCQKYIAPYKQYNFRSLQPLDEMVFSDSDLEALGFAWDHFGHLDRWLLRDLTHNYPEWEKHEASLNAGNLSVEMDLMDFLEDPNTDVNKCFELNAKDRAIRQEELQEMADLESLWR
jgi:uncharacterized phage-associated protein